MKEVICIVCPKGCRLSVDEKHDCKVTGNRCPLGEPYGREELVNPTRVVCSTVRLDSAAHPRLPVKTDKPIARDKVFAAVKLLNDCHCHCPVHMGDVVAARILGTDVNFVATHSILE